MRSSSEPGLALPGLRSAFLVLTLLAVATVPARADVAAWLRGSALPRLGVGVEVGVTVPTEPDDFAEGLWDDGRGFGVSARCALTPTVDVLLRAGRDHFALDAEDFRLPGATVEGVAGTDATMDVLLLGLRVHHERGALRGHAALYAGLVRRTGQQASVTYVRDDTTSFAVMLGEPDGTDRAFGFGVGVTWAVPRLPDLTAEARVIWLAEGPGAAMIPLRVGVTLP